MKRISFSLLFACLLSIGFAQTMVRTPVLDGTAIQYTPAHPKSVVIILPGKGERGTDLSIIETNIAVAKDLKAGKFAVDRIIIFQQIPTSLDGFYANKIGPLVAYAKKFNLPIDISGLSLGGMGVGLNLPDYPGVFRSAMTCPGKVEQNVPAITLTTNPPQYNPGIDYVAAYSKIPSIHYYDPADNTIADGYGSTKRLVTQLQTTGKTDISLIELPGKGHNVWDYAYGASNYWKWLDALDSQTQLPAQPVVYSIDSVSYKKGMADMKQIILSNIGKLN